MATPTLPQLMDEIQDRLEFRVDENILEAAARDVGWGVLTIGTAVELLRTNYQAGRGNVSIRRNYQAEKIWNIRPGSCAA